MPKPKARAKRARDSKETRFGRIPEQAGRIKTIGVLTGGGDCPGLNAVIRAVVKTAITVYRWKVIGFEDGFEGMILPGKERELDLDSVKGILPRGGTILGSTNRGNPFNFPVERQNKIVSMDCSHEVVETYRRLKLDALVVIGGDGTLSIARDLGRKRGLKCVAVPKTIDNDLNATDVTFGFDTAVTTATEAIDKLHTTAESHHRVMFVEVMGRDAGWIALYAGLAGSADAILLPEIPYDITKLIKKIRSRENMGRKSSIVVVAEGARPKGGGVSYLRQANPPFDLVRLGGAAQRVADEVEALSGKETRVTVLGHVQRGGSPTAFDRNLGTRMGTAAVHAAARGEFGKMVALRGNSIIIVPLAEAVAHKKSVDPHGEIVQAARAVGTDFCSTESEEPR
jgi:6-phosphofructokinase 1